MESLILKNMLQEQPWNVFIPNQIQNEPSSFLCGEVKEESRIICVYGCCQSEPTNFLPNVIGYWKRSGEHHESKFMIPFSSKYKISLSRSVDGNLSCLLKIEVSPGVYKGPPVVCIIYTPKDILSSFIMAKVHPQTDVLHKETIKPKEDLNNVHCHKRKEENIAVLFQCLNKTLREKGLEKVLLFHRKPKYNFQRFVFLFPRMLSTVLFLIGEQIEQGLGKLPPIILYGLGRPSIFQHLQERYTMCWTVGYQKRSSVHQRFLIYNAYSQQAVDSVLGICLCGVLVYYGISQTLADVILGWADDVAKELDQLVKALMGAPAGLKLNAQLTQIMGVFFQYHIYLWTGYLSILRSVMPDLLWFLSWTGMLGLTCQVCVISDVLTALTLHIYCFYVYAARMFYLQVYALGSLWRLFRGKKWNVLRSRVDSAVYNTDQLFVGTLLFTMLLFLLPTTALYYTVFTLLRILVLFVQGLLLQIVSVALNTPVYTIALRIFAPKLIAGSVLFNICHVPQDEKCLVLDMQTSQLPLRDIKRLSFPVSKNGPQPKYTWGQFLSNIATGKLVYPWVDRTSSVLPDKAS